MVMTPRDRKAELVRRGIKMTQIARSIGMSGGHVEATIAGKRRSPRVEEAVAALLDRTVDEVFGPIPNGAAA